MRISELLNETTMKIDLEARNKSGAIEELVDLLVEEHEISLADRSHVIQAILQREEMVSTGMEYGVALPHGAVSCVEEVVAALGVSKQGLDFQSIDGRLTYIIILLVLPKEKYSAGVRTMAGISRVLTSDGLRDRLRAAGDAGEIMDIIIEEDDRQC
ncbi:hypothetical protein BVY04_02670 [bacterium M21]|nr:hypothetical protein BVY04_02670 [bacterium M21]